MPARLRDVIRVAESLGCEVRRPRSGSHWRFLRPGCRTYPISAHNGLRSEVPDAYILALCRNFGFDPEMFRKLLQG